MLELVQLGRRGLEGSPMSPSHPSQGCARANLAPGLGINLAGSRAGALTALPWWQVPSAPVVVLQQRSAPCSDPVQLPPACAIPSGRGCTLEHFKERCGCSAKRLLKSSDPLLWYEKSERK